MEINDLLGQVIIADLRAAPHDTIAPWSRGRDAVAVASAVAARIKEDPNLFPASPEAPGALTHLAALEAVNRQLRESAAKNATANDELRAEVKTLREELAREKAASSGVAGRLALALVQAGGRIVISAEAGEALAGRSWAIKDEAGESGTRVLRLHFTDEPQPAAPSPEEIPS